MTKQDGYAAFKMTIGDKPYCVCPPCDKQTELNNLRQLTGKSAEAVDTDIRQIEKKGIEQTA